VRVDRLVHRMESRTAVQYVSLCIHVYMQPDREGDGGGGGGDLAGRQQGGILVEIRHVEYNVSPPTKYRAGPGTSQQLTLALPWTKLFLTGQISVYPAPSRTLYQK
jgi:hypothetical protein